MHNDLRARVADDYAGIVLDNLNRDYPHSAHHTQTSDADRPSPAEIHPAFYSSFDWHSCVHMHWLGASLLHPQRTDDGGWQLGTSGSAALRAAMGANLTAEKLRAEGEYLLANPSWERPYGWAWLLRLAATCAGSADAQVRSWGAALDPLADVVAQLATNWLAKAEYPVRHGLHTNSAFGVGYLLDAFRALGREQAAEACREAALHWFSQDRNWAADWELSGQDFLSAGLSEADLLRRVLEPAAFAAWFEGFLPALSGESRILLPVAVRDETDGYLVHLHGLNLTRAGQVARILGTLRLAGTGEAQQQVLSQALDPLLQAGLAGLRSGNFMSTHWLASFAWDALESVAALESAASPN